MYIFQSNIKKKKKKIQCIVAKYFILSTNCLRSDRLMLYLYCQLIKENKKI